MSKGSFITRVPKTIPGLTLWLDAADASTITIATGVSTWKDKSGNGFNVAQATGSRQPTYTTNLQSGLPGIVFDGVSYVMGGSSNSVLMDPELGYMSIFVVNKCVAATVGYGAGKGRLNGTGSSAGWAQGNNSGALQLQAGTSTPATIGSSNTISTPESNASVKEWYFTGSTLDYLKDGVALGVQRSYSVSVTTTSVLSIGGRFSSNDVFTNENVFEIIIFKNSLTTAERLQIRQYLGNKWGVAVS